jgi:hypothetical protein
MSERSTSKLHASFIIAGFVLVSLVATYAAATISASWQAQKQMPRLAVDSLVKALRMYYQQTGRFPNDFNELEARLWKHRQAPKFGADGRALAIANYYLMLRGKRLEE